MRSDPGSFFNALRKLLYAHSRAVHPQIPPRAAHCSVHSILPDTPLWSLETAWLSDYTVNLIRNICYQRGSNNRSGIIGLYFQSSFELP
jgi:hypothetical protein